MTKKKSVEFLCSGCGNVPPDEDVADAGWYTVIRAWKGGTRTFVYCPACHSFQYGAPLKKTEEQAGSTWH